MKKIVLSVFLFLFSSSVFSANEGHLSEGMVNPGFYEKPGWFKDSFLELDDDLKDANENNRQIILYFHQDGCPYCKKLLDDNFSDKGIVEKISQNFDLLEINMWGDKTVTLISGEETTEKEFAKQMKVMFTPTLIVLDKNGQAQLRMNGYYAPDKFSAALDFVLAQTGKAQEKIKTSEALLKVPKEKFISRANDLESLINTSKKPVMILFEQSNCSECDELHGDIFRRLPVYKQLQQFTIAQVDINSEETIIAPDGNKLNQKSLAESLNIQYTPSLLFYESGGSNNKSKVKKSDGMPIFRSEAYLKSFHVQAVFDYILSQSYLTETEFQRFVQRRADKMAADGIEVDLWD